MRKKVIILENVNVSYGKKKILDKINLEVTEGEVVGLLGPNGAGKTTLMKAMCGLSDMDTGSIKICGYDIKKNKKDVMKLTGVLIEDTCAYEKLSGLDNLKILAGMYDKYDMKKLVDIVDIIGLKDSINDKFKTYSLGMKKRLGIGMALINEPQILLLDEPTNGLDIEGQHEISELIKKLVSQKNISVLISSHITGQLEKICNRTIFIKKGKLIANVNMDELGDKSLEDYYLETMEEKGE